MGNKTLKQTSVAVRILKGTAICLLVLLLGTAILAKLLELEWISEESMGYGVMVILMTSSFCGACRGKRKSNQHKLLIEAGIGGMYFLSLLALACFFFHGNYRGVGETFLLILCGSGLAYLAGNRGDRGKKWKKSSVSNW